MYRWIDFIEVENPGKKTKRWKVVNHDTGDTLGGVYWWTAWRRYIFHPMPGTIYEQDCLRDIASFLIDKMVEHKAELDKRDK